MLAPSSVEKHEIEDVSAIEKTNHPIVFWLDDRITNVVSRIKQQPFWLAVNNKEVDESGVRTMMKELYLEIVGYQPHVIEAAIAAIGQMPRSMEPRMVRTMLFHQTDEFDHGEMALRDYVALGGDETEARSKRMSPAANAVAGMWWMISHLRDPFAYLGALYLFEGLTPIVSAAVKDGLMARGLERQKGLEFIDFHATEDLKHTAIVRHLISQVAYQYPESIDSIKHGYDCFEFVYPIPVWQSAYERALAQLNG